MPLQSHPDYNGRDPIQQAEACIDHAIDLGMSPEQVIDYVLRVERVRLTPSQSRRVEITGVIVAVDGDRRIFIA